MELRLRRLCRNDTEIVGEITAAAGVPKLAADRAALRRFRRVVADLGADFYVATVRERGVGLVHVAYTRDLFLGNRAHLLALVVAPDHRDEVGRRLLEKAHDRARKRNCLDLRVLPGPGQRIWKFSCENAGGGRSRPDFGLT